jgi:RNA polymerase sigma factor (sigma-70 family)
MKASESRGVARELRTLYDAGAIGGLTDGHLLERFVAERDETAFEALVRRHGPMVFGVCRRIVANRHDAEDAFQATFLVLANRAASIAPSDMLPNWLHGVARRTAMKARAVASRRCQREKQVVVLPETESLAPEVFDDRLRWLDHELSHLPDKYRTPLILCELQGLCIPFASPSH